MSKKPKRQDETRRLVALAQTAAADADTEDLSSDEERLADRVVRLIAKGSDRSILRALEWLDAQHAHEAADLLAFWAEDAADTVEVVLNQDGHAAAGEATTFLVPMVLAAPRDKTLPLAIPLTAPFGQLTQSFRAHQLIGIEPSLVLLPRLFRLADLPSTWSGRRQWLNSLLAALREEPTSGPRSTPEPVEDAEGMPGLMLHLRFLAGAIVDDGTDRGRPVWDASDRSPEADTIVDHLESWQRTAADLLQEALRVTVVIPGVPNLWRDALNDGLDLWNHATLGTSLEAFCQQSGVTRER